MRSFRKYLFLGVCGICGSFSAMGQQTTPQYPSIKASVDSLEVQQNYQQGMDLFLDFCDYLHPLQLSQIEEIAVANAQEELSSDALLFTPDTTSLFLNDHDVVYDYAPYLSDEIVAEKMAKMNTTIPMTFNSTIRNFIDYFTMRRRSYTLAMLSRKNLYFPIFEKTLAEHNLPDELKYLSIVESALKPTAISRAGAAGLWQFMPQTGRSLGLRQDAYVDERMHPEKSTVAACKYLYWLYSFFGDDWELALAAYNCGPGTVQRAIRRAGGGKQTFWDIYRFLPAETRSYVPMFVAVTYTMTHAEDHNIIQNEPMYPIDHETVYTNQYVNLKEVAIKLNVCEADLAELNPELKKKIVPSHYKNYALRIPAERSEFFWDNQEYVLASSKNSWLYDKKGSLLKEREKDRLKKEKLMKTAKAVENRKHLVKTGETLSEIAHTYHISVAQIMAWNNLKTPQIKAGKHLIVKPLGYQKTMQFVQGDGVIEGQDKIQLQTDNTKAVVKTVSYKTKNTATKQQKTKVTAFDRASANGTTHTVKNGESLWIIAKKYGVSVEKIKQLNGLSKSNLNIGQRILVK